MIKEKFEKLLQEEIKNKENLESLLKEFYKITDEIYSIRNRTYVNWTGNTKNKEYEEKYKNFIEKIDPELKKYTFNFYKKIFDSGFIDEIENQVFKKIIEVEIRLHREENIELEKKEEELKMEYEKIISEFSFELEGKKLTLSEIESKLENKEREIREKAFFEMHFNIYKKREKFNKLMDELVKLRNKKAINADFKNYRDMCWIQLLRFDYRPEDTDEYREGVRKYIKPIYENYLEILKEKLKLKEIKPWDIFASIFQRDEIKLFKDEEELIKLALNVAERIDPFFKEVIEILYKNKRLDLMARENKSQGGYMVYIHEDKLPYIFMNASGKIDDFMTFMHELGHCVNYMLSRDIENPYIRMPVSEFAELISIAMEFFTLEELKNIIDENLYKDIFTKYYSLILKRLTHIGKIDGFQHFLYLNPDHSWEKRESYFIELDKKLSPSNVNWDSIEYLKNVTWYKQLHIFLYPFYYIDYGIALLSAIRLWKIYRENKKDAITRYKRGMSLGGTKTLKELFESTGIEFSLNERNILEVSEYLKELIEEIL